MPVWNPWHGCQKISAGCENCYVYRIDGGHNRQNSFIVRKNNDFDLPVRKNKNGSYKLTCDNNEYVFTCMTSDFFNEDADLWRAAAWNMIRERRDLRFFIITKRIHRFENALPSDWKDGYENVTVCCTVENQKSADFRLPVFFGLPIRHKHIANEPLLESIDFKGFYGKARQIEQVSVGGESGSFEQARVCDYDWVLGIRRQCLENEVSFHFRQTGANFFKDGKLYRIPRKFQYSQARKAGISVFFN